MISKRHITSRGHSVLGPKNPLVGGGVNTPFLMNRLRTQIDSCSKLTVSGILKGIAIDGYISGATVDVYDTKTNTKIASTTTRQDGSWEITDALFNENSDYYKISVRGGTDVVSGNTIEIELVSYGKPNTNSITITPTTTLVSYLIDADQTPQRTFEQKLETHKTTVKTLVGNMTKDPFSHDFTVETNDINIYKTNVKLYQYLSLYKDDSTKKTALIADISGNKSETISVKLVKSALNNTNKTINGKTFTAIAAAIDAKNTISDLHDTIKTNIGKVAPTGSVQLSAQKGKSGATINFTATFDTVLDSAVQCTFQLVDITSEANLLAAAVTLTFGPTYKTATGSFTVPSGDKQAKIKFLTGKSLGGIAVASTPSNNPTFIIDNTPPVITLKQPIVSQINLNTSYTDPGATAVDSVDGPCQVISSGTINTAITGDQTITYSSTDAAGNTATLPRTIRVVDPNGPTIVLAGENPIYLEAGTSFNFVDPGATATDSAGNSVIVTTEQMSGQTPQTFINSVDKKTKATYTITYKATNSSNQTSTRTRTVIVRDTIGPVITLSSNNTPVYLEQNTGNLSSVQPTATALDAVDGSRNVTITNNVNVNAAGTYQITYTAADLSGNTSTKTIPVIVRDTTPPVITLLGDNPYTIEASTNTAYVDPGATAFDDVDGNVTVTKTGSVTKNVKGTYLLQYNATDQAGNAASPVTRTVIVRDTTPPTLIVPNTIISVSSDSSITTFDFKTGVSAFDIVDGDVSNNIKVSSDYAGIFPSPFTWATSVAAKPYSFGNYSIFYDVKDSSNNAAIQQTRTLNVYNADAAPPSITINTSDIYIVKDDIETLSGGAYDNNINKYVLDVNDVSAIHLGASVLDDVTLKIDVIYPELRDVTTQWITGTKWSDYQINIFTSMTWSSVADDPYQTNIYKFTYSITKNGQKRSDFRYVYIGKFKYNIGYGYSSRYRSGTDYESYGKFMITDMSGVKTHMQYTKSVLEDIIYKPLRGRTINRSTGIISVLPYDSYNSQLSDMTNYTNDGESYETFEQILNNNIDIYSNPGKFDFIVAITNINNDSNSGTIAYDENSTAFEKSILVNGKNIKTSTIMGYNLRYSHLFSGKTIGTALHEMLHGHGINFSGTPELIVTKTLRDTQVNYEESMLFFTGQKAFSYYKQKLQSIGFNTSELIGVPLESTKGMGGGSEFSHWEDAACFDPSGVYHPAFKNDLMVYSAGSNQYLSKLSAYTLMDLGYPYINMNSKYIVDYSSNHIAKETFKINVAKYKTANGTIKELDYYNSSSSGNSHTIRSVEKYNSYLYLFIDVFYVNINDPDANILCNLRFNTNADGFSSNGTTLANQNSNASNISLTKDTTSGLKNHYTIKLVIGIDRANPPNGMEPDANYINTTYYNSPSDTTTLQCFTIFFYNKNGTRLIYDNTFSLDNIKQDSYVYFRMSP